MKKVLFIAALMVTGLTAARAQNYIVVNTETIFKAIPAYNSANTELDRLGETRQAEIDSAFEQVEVMYNAYMQQKQYLAEAARQQREKAILDREAEITKRQEEIFGPEGELMQRRVALIKPIQDRVFKAIADYAKRNGDALVLDVASNPAVLYYSPAADKTQEIIKLVK
jgi:outer membrane protein